MTPWLGLDRLGFFLIRIFLRLCTRANALPSNPDELQLAPNTPVVYVLRDRSAADAAAADAAPAPEVAPVRPGPLHAQSSSAANASQLQASAPR
jgi:glycerol-3-phosphate O-acyltransferase